MLIVQLIISIASGLRFQCCIQFLLKTVLAMFWSIVLLNTFGNIFNRISSFNDSRKQEIWANAHETHHSISLISYAGCLGLSPFSSIFQRKFTLSVRRSLKIAKNHLKPIFWGFKVVQGHRCWYPRKARRQCLLWYAASLCLSATVFTLDEPIAVK